VMPLTVTFKFVSMSHLPWNVEARPLTNPESD